MGPKLAKTVNVPVLTSMRCSRLVVTRRPPASLSVSVSLRSWSRSAPHVGRTGGCSRLPAEWSRSPFTSQDPHFQVDCSSSNLRKATDDEGCTPTTCHQGEQMLRTRWHPCYEATTSTVPASWRSIQNWSTCASLCQTIPSVGRTARTPSC